MAMVVNNSDLGGGVQKTPEQIAAEIERNQAEAARQRKIQKLKSEIKELEAEIKKLQEKQIEYSEMVGSIGGAIPYLEQAKGNAKEIRSALTCSYNGKNARTYVNQLDNCEGDIALNISKLTLVSAKANDKITEIQEIIEDKLRKIKNKQDELKKI